VAWVLIAAIGCSAPVAAPQAGPRTSGLGPRPEPTAPAAAPAPAPAPPPPPAPPPDPHVTLATAATLLADGTPPTDCNEIDCLLALAYASDAKALELARTLYKDTGDVAGVGPVTDMDGGFRGQIHLVPELPVGRYRRHLAWVVGAMRDYDDFFAKLYDGAPDGTAPHYRWRDLEVRFVRSERKHTPSAYALMWNVSYNVEGSLLVGADAVRETLFHEIFHMNDDDHGDWSGTTLRADYDAIIAKCGTARTSTACLAPYAPSDTKVRGGTYYAFTQDNGDPVHEYGAELALRYYREQREMLHRNKLSRRAFKCGPPENARSWNALVTEFFGGRDLVPACRQ
jgi:hypothetical protein